MKRLTRDDFASSFDVCIPKRLASASSTTCHDIHGGWMRDLSVFMFCGLRVHSLTAAGAKYNYTDIIQEKPLVATK